MMMNSQQSWLKRWKTSHHIWISKHKYLPRWSCTHGCLCESILFTGCFHSWPSLWAFHMTERERDGMKEGKKWKGGRERERQKYRGREDTLGQTDHQWPSFPQLYQWLNWSLLPGWLCVWMRCVQSQNTHRWSFFFFLNGWATITLTRWTVCGY